MEVSNLVLKWIHPNKKNPRPVSYGENVSCHCFTEFHLALSALPAINMLLFVAVTAIDRLGLEKKRSSKAQFEWVGIVNRDVPEKLVQWDFLVSTQESSKVEFIVLKARNQYTSGYVHFMVHFMKEISKFYVKWMNQRVVVMLYFRLQRSASIMAIGSPYRRFVRITHRSERLWWKAVSPGAK